MGRPVLILVGVLVALLGLLFTGQGLNLIPGSFMTGVRTWFWVGLALIVVGTGLAAAGFRRGPAARP